MKKGLSVLLLLLAFAAEAIAQSRSAASCKEEGDTLMASATQDFSQYYFDWEKAESPLDSALEIGSLMAYIVPLPKANAIEAAWLKSFALDSSQKDLRGSLCFLYAVSLQTDKLKAMLTQYAASNDKDDQFPYQLADFARLLKVRGKFEDAMQVYQHIADLYPKLAGIRCDIAYEYYAAGKRTDALRYLDSCLTKPFVDETSWLNTATLYSLMGEFDHSQHAFDEYSKRYNNVQAQFYRGLVLFSQSDTACLQQWKLFLEKADETHYADEVRLAKLLLPQAQPNNKVMPEAEMVRLLTDAQIPNYYQSVLLQFADAKFSFACAPLLLQAKFYMAEANYREAFSFLRSSSECRNNNPDLKARQNLFLAFTYAKTNDMGTALLYYTEAQKGTSPFAAQAAQYFIAKQAREAGDSEKAKALFLALRDAKVKTKYSELAKSYL